MAKEVSKVKVVISWFMIPSSKWGISIILWIIFDYLHLHCFLLPRSQVGCESLRSKEQLRAVIGAELEFRLQRAKSVGWVILLSILSDIGAWSIMDLFWVKTIAELEFRLKSIYSHLFYEIMHQSILVPIWMWDFILELISSSNELINFNSGHSWGLANSLRQRWNVPRLVETYLG